MLVGAMRCPSAFGSDPRDLVLFFGKVDPRDLVDSAQIKEEIRVSPSPSISCAFEFGGI